MIVQATGYTIRQARRTTRKALMKVSRCSDSLLIRAHSASMAARLASRSLWRHFV